MQIQSKTCPFSPVNVRRQCIIICEVALECSASILDNLRSKILLAK
jgi:hypothetical protein